MQVMKWCASLALACVTLSGCAFTGGPGAVSKRQVVQRPVVEEVSSDHLVCDRPGKEGCFELISGNYRYDPMFPAMQGLGRLASTEEERMRWTSFGGLFHRTYVDGRVFASTPRTFRIYMWHVRPVSARNLSAYQYDGKEVRRWGVADITGTIRETPWFNQDPRLGPPQKVYRIAAFGNSPHAASLQIPWSMVTGETFILVCQEDGLNLHPPRRSETDSGGFWFTPKLLTWHRSEKRSTEVRFAFLTP